jgi:mannosylglycoprotein endo-beta-mannosidase
MVLPLANTGSDHVPCVVVIDTSIPKTKLFRLENYWVDMPGFMDCVSESWSFISHKPSSATVITDKLKNLRYALKKWHVSLARIKYLIQNCNKVILYLDTLEENRPLYNPEYNFRNILRVHLDELLLAECNYWRKRCTIRWIKQGEDNTKIFHAMATERYRRNNIAMLKNSEGIEISDHQEMARLLWVNYRDRMGSSEGISMQYDLGSLLAVVEGLDELTVPFTKDEMDGVIKHMPSDRAPGPDGFNGLFVKKCWPIIKEEFYNLAKEFHE